MSKQGVKLSFFTSVFVMGVISACDRSDQDALLQRNRSGQEQNQQSTGSGNRRLPVNSNINNEGPNFADSSFALADIALAQKPTTTFRSEKFKNKYFNIGDFYDLNNWNATWYKSLYDGHLVYTVNCSNSMKAFYWKKQNNKCDATHLFADFSEQNYMFDTYSSAEDIYSMAKALTQYFEYSDSANPNFDLINQSNHPLASNPNFNEEYWLKGKYNWHIIAKDGIYYVRNGAAIPIVRFGYDLEERFPLYYILIGKDPSLISPKDSKVKIFKIIRDFETIKVFGENLQLLEATEGSDTRDIQRHRIFKMISYYAPDRTELVNSQTKQVVVSNKLINQINTGTVEVVHHGSGVYQFSIPIAIDAKSIVTVGGRTCEASVDELSNRSGRKCLFEIQNPPLLKALPVTVRSESNEITASFNLFFKKPEVDRVDFSVREGEIDYYGPSYNFPWIRYRSPDFSQGPKFEGLDCQIATWENSLYDDTGLVKSNKTFVTINPKNK
ncbi:MAG: hypothetical protein NT027_03405, partial [Proteobacteria bacterium]|nr:hypothetical protein [Pseudomonadota bacterium]